MMKKLFGDASNRVYYRDKDKTGRSVIIMELPEGTLSASEEITNLAQPPKEIPFLNVQRFLSAAGLPVPEVYYFDAAKRHIGLEDLGDTLLFHRVEKSGGANRLREYKKAIDRLIDFQNTRRGGKNCVAFERSFDATLLNWEFDHYWEFLGKGDYDLFQKTTRRITEELLALPQVLVHRDFQSRNLMWHQNRFYLIDFQDALIGPQPYDLVALLRDSYIDLSEVLPELIDYYCAQAGCDRKAFQRAFDLQTVQRKLKDAGRFVYIDKVKKNPNYLQYIPLTLEYVRQALKKLPEYQTLTPALSQGERGE